ncbi:ubiquitin carboxyl-terminal hydrolase 35 [Aricia agestis]|uniref:ubiquitin carboxyl-terminal hydrolase 35 n=1 Tax=Aricia agestis TaxID=91739 RepID=UPI001C204273|nr:ubiquitin carboxyl-terminal hydrolase 35 [Aricia agestis]
MAVKKHKLGADHQKQIDLMALAKYLQLLNEQQNYIPQAPEMMQNCQDILKCLARTSGNEDELWQLLQPIEEFLLRVVRNADCVIAILDKFYAYISDPQSVIYPPIADVLVVIEGADEESILMAAKWVVKQRKDEPTGTNHTVALSRLYLWLCNWHGTPALGNWILAYIKALEESQRFNILIEASLEQVGNLFLALGDMLVFHQSYVRVTLHVLESLRESAEAFDKISPYIERVLVNLASDSEQWSRELLQKLVDILTAMVDCISNRNTATEQIQFRNRYATVLNCLELHISSRTSSFLPPWRVNPDDATIVPSSTRAPPMIKVGLVNLGNTCYMNSVLQALFAARKFSVHVMMNLHVGGYWAKIGELFAKMMFGKSPSVPPIDLYDAIKMSAFSGNQQHDSSEFLSHLFNRLRASEHTAKDNDNNNYNNGTVSDSSSDSEQTKQHAFASGSRKRHNDGAESGVPRRRYKVNSQSMLRNTFVEEMFGGAQLARVECSHCQNCVVSRDVFCELHLSFPEKLMDKTHSVQSLLEFYCTTERMTGDNRFLCTECGELRDADRSVRIDHYPIHLVLVLKNFEYDVKNSVHTKLMHNVVCDLNIVMPALRSQKKGSYNLFAAVIHNGINIDSGHYYTVAKNDTWYRFDDSHVTPIDESKLNNLGYASTPYILFYIRSDVEEVELPTLDQLPQRLQDAVNTYNKFYHNHR